MTACLLVIDWHHMKCLGAYLIRLVGFCSLTGLPEESGNIVATSLSQDMNEYPYTHDLMCDKLNEGQTINILQNDLGKTM